MGLNADLQASNERIVCRLEDKIASLTAKIEREIEEEANFRKDYTIEAFKMKKLHPLRKEASNEHFGER